LNLECLLFPLFGLRARTLWWDFPGNSLVKQRPTIVNRSFFHCKVERRFLPIKRFKGLVIRGLNLAGRLVFGAQPGCKGKQGVIKKNDCSHGDGFLMKRDWIKRKACCGLKRVLIDMTKVGG